MLTDPEEICIIAEARQKNIRDPARSREHFHRIFNDFISPVNFANTVLLDLGPGQYDFAILARERGAITYGVDNDPAVIRLGNHKKFPVLEKDLKKLGAADFDFQFDGLFCKYSINAFWFHANDEHLVEYISQLGHLLKPGGWGWVAPWNGVPKKASLSVSRIREILTLQARLFKELGFETVDLTEELSAYYGVHGVTGNRALFFRNVERPKSLADCRPL